MVRRAHALFENALSAVNLCSSSSDARKVQRAQRSGCGPSGIASMSAVARAGAGGGPPRSRWWIWGDHRTSREYGGLLARAHELLLHSREPSAARLAKCVICEVIRGRTRAMASLAADPLGGRRPDQELCLNRFREVLKSVERCVGGNGGRELGCELQICRRSMSWQSRSHGWGALLSLNIGHCRKQ